MKIEQFFLPLLIMLTLTSHAIAQQVLHGNTKNESGGFIRDVKVVHQRLNYSTITNENGAFELMAVQAGDLISFSHILYEDTVIILKDHSQTLSVQLKMRGKTIDEVEVFSTGYEMLPKDRSTGSFTVVANERLSEQIHFNIMDRLPAVASGLMLDRNSRTKEQLLVRGMSTIFGDTKPLIVLDNFPYEGDLANINPDDIETVSILKDAAAASIWGARAANGVIVISSKKAHVNQKLKTSFNSQTAMESKPDLFSLDRVSSSDMIDIENMLFENGYFTTMINSDSRPALSPAVELFVQKSAATDPNVIATINKELDRLRRVDVRNDFLNYVYQPGWQQQSTLGLTQGSDRFLWNATASNAIVKDNLNNGTKRNTFLTNSRIFITDRLIADAQVNISFLANRSGKLGYGSIYSYNSGLFPYAEFADVYGHAIPLTKNWRTTFLENEVHSDLLDWNYYPLEDYKHDVSKSASQNTLLSSALEYSLAKWFKLSLRYQFQKQIGVSEALKSVESYEARNMINSYAKDNAVTGGIDFIIPKGGIFDQSNSNITAHNMRGQLDFNWEMPLHKVFGLIGTEVRSVATKSDGKTLYGYNPDNLTHSILDFTTPFLHYITGAQVNMSSGLSLTQKNDRFISTFFNGSYTFLDRYTATFSARRDASNLFGLHINDKWNPFWSTGFSWLVSKEPFWSDKMISYLKLRATYGKTGNLNPAMVALTTIKYVGPNPFTQTPYAKFEKYSNPDLKWETVGVTNIGLDFSTRHNRVAGTIEGYYKKGTNLFGISPMDYTSGVDPFLLKNVASIETSGLDLTINTLNTTGAVKWKSNIILSKSRDKVTKSYIESDIASQFVGTTNTIRGREGFPVYGMYAYKWMGLDPVDGAPLGFLNGEASRSYRQFTGANATVDDLVYQGSVQPRVFGSLGNTIAWKEWSMNFRMTFKFDYYFRKPTILYSSLFSTWDGDGDFNKRWRQPGDEKKTNVPAMIYPVPSGAENFYRFAEPFVERGDHIRLEYVSLTYQFPTESRLGARLKDASATININNLGIIYRKNKAGIDPDFTSVSGVTLAPSKVYSLTIKCTL